MRILLLILFFAVSIQAQPLKKRIMAIQSHDDLSDFLDKPWEITEQKLNSFREEKFLVEGLRFESDTTFIDGAHHSELLSASVIFRITLSFVEDFDNTEPELLKRGFPGSDLKALNHIVAIDTRELFSMNYRREFKQELEKRSIHNFPVGIEDYRDFFSSKFGKTCLKDEAWIIAFLEAEAHAISGARKSVALELMSHLKVHSIRVILSYGYEVVAKNMESSFGPSNSSEQEIEYFLNMYKE